MELFGRPPQSMRIKEKRKILIRQVPKFGGNIRRMVAGYARRSSREHQMKENTSITQLNGDGMVEPMNYFRILSLY
jgi:hypothetical protein